MFYDTSRLQFKFGVGIEEYCGGISELSDLQQQKEMSSPWYIKGEFAGNAEKVKQFYQAVLKDFIVKLQREFRYKGVITDQQLEQMEFRINQKLKFPETLMNKCVDMKEGSYKPESEVKNQPNPRQIPELKEEYNEDKDEYLMGANLKGKDDKAQQSQREEEQNQLQLFQQIQLGKADHNFTKIIKSETEVKKEDNSHEQEKQKKPIEPEIVKNEEESEQNQEQITIQQCLQGLNSIILATFSAQTLRHKPKEERITVNLDNSFLKTPYNQIFIGNISIDITKMQKSDIRQDQYSTSTSAKFKKGK